MDAGSLSDLPRLLQDEGHPILWYALLWSGYHLTSSTYVLPVLSVLIAGVAVMVFVAGSPFPRWLKAMFVFSGLPLYEYSVSARNYGISMLIMFAFAWLYPLRRTHPILLGLVLALLCNTNIHSLLLGGVLLAMWGWDLFAESGLGSRDAIQFGAAVCVVAAGMAAAVMTVRPTNQMAASDSSAYTLPNVAQAILETAKAPARAFPDIAPSPPGVLAPVGSILLVAATVGLIGQPAALAAALTGLVALSVLFQIVYPGGYRHQGLFVVFLMTLYWIVLASGGTRRRINAWTIWRGPVSMARYRCCWASSWSPGSPTRTETSCTKKAAARRWDVFCAAITSTTGRSSSASPTLRWSRCTTTSTIRSSSFASSGSAPSSGSSAAPARR